MPDGRIALETHLRAVAGLRTSGFPRDTTKNLAPVSAVRKRANTGACLTTVAQHNRSRSNVAIDDTIPELEGKQLFALMPPPFHLAVRVAVVDGRVVDVHRIHAATGIVVFMHGVAFGANDPGVYNKSWPSTFQRTRNPDIWLATNQKSLHAIIMNRKNRGKT